jgi:hypothetical protein
MMRRMKLVVAVVPFPAVEKCLKLVKLLLLRFLFIDLIYKRLNLI